MISIYNFFQKRGQLFALLLGVITVALVFGTAMSGMSAAGFGADTDLNTVLKNGGGDGFNFFNLAIYLPFFLTVIAAALWLIFGLGRLATNPKGSLIVLIGAVVLIGLFFILYSSSDAETTGKLGMLSEKFDVSTGVSKFISGGIKCTAVLAFGALASMVILEIVNLFK